MCWPGLLLYYVKLPSISMAFALLDVAQVIQKIRFYCRSSVLITFKLAISVLEVCPVNIQRSIKC